ncbi:YdcF family protein [Ramlibacter sp. AN1133]|uniref:YdcF family protein n=1 Tax=Ramlibacter sp. AN1133 TaxID=3133429 RepID=UPI0030C02805
MQPGELKPILTALVLPPTGPLLLALLGLLLATRRRTAGLALAAVCIVLSLALGSHAVARLLARELLPPVTAARTADLRDVQAIVVLGAGVWPDPPEYGSPQPSEPALVRLRYAARLARQTGKPLAFAGGAGWGGVAGAESEGTVSRRMLQEDYGLAVRWLDDRSRDTEENAVRMAQLAGRDGVRRIALVTDAIHMPRAAAAFRRAGFDVVPAPTDFPRPQHNAVLEWLPSTPGLAACRHVIREWLGGVVARATH